VNVGQVAHRRSSTEPWRLVPFKFKWSNAITVDVLKRLGFWCASCRSRHRLSHISIRAGILIPANVSKHGITLPSITAAAH